MDADANANANANADAGGSTIALRELCSRELKTISHLLNEQVKNILLLSLEMVPRILLNPSAR